MRPFDDERPEGAAPAAQGRDEDRLAFPVRLVAEDLWLVEAEAARGGCVGVAGGDLLTRLAGCRVGRGHQAERPVPAVVQPDRGALGADVPVEFLEHLVERGAQPLRRRDASPERPGELPERGLVGGPGPAGAAMARVAARSWVAGGRARTAVRRHSKVLKGKGKMEVRPEWGARRLNRSA